MPRALDLFCGAGGASMGLHRAGFEVVGVDIDQQPNYPFEFVQADALSVELGGFDLIWASPPCQRFSQATHQTGNPDDHPDLIAAIRWRLIMSGAPYVIENVLRAPLRDPQVLCGAMFGLRVVRHRLFETNWGYRAPHHVKHAGSIVTGEYVTVASNGGVPAWTLKERERRGLPRHIPGEWSMENWSSAMGIDWMERHELVEAIPPAYSEHIGRAALEMLEQRSAA